MKTITHSKSRWSCHMSSGCLFLLFLANFPMVPRVSCTPSRSYMSSLVFYFILFIYIYLFIFKAVGTIFAFLFMPYKAWTNDHKCNTWSRQKLSPQRPSTPEEHSHKMMLKKKKKKLTLHLQILFYLFYQLIL